MALLILLHVLLVYYMDFGLSMLIGIGRLVDSITWPEEIDQSLTKIRSNNHILNASSLAIPLYPTSFHTIKIFQNGPPDTMDESQSTHVQRLLTKKSQPTLRPRKIASLLRTQRILAKRCTLAEEVNVCTSYSPFDIL